MTSGRRATRQRVAGAVSPFPWSDLGSLRPSGSIMPMRTAARRCQRRAAGDADLETLDSEPNADVTCCFGVSRIGLASWARQGNREPGHRQVAPGCRDIGATLIKILGNAPRPARDLSQVADRRFKVQ